MYRPLAVLAPGLRDEPVVRGRICNLGGLAGPGDVRDLDYDGRTLALAVPYELGAAPNHVRFASLLGADLDRNANCIEDSVEIAAQPAFDWNTNGRLDTSERRGVVSCPPMQPNSTGRAALLELVGTEFADSSDLYAAGSGLPPLALALLFVARDLSAVPTATGPVAVQPGETWSWQLAYRDVGGFAATGAAHLPFR